MSIGLFATLALLLVGANAKAQAADCMSYDACIYQYNAQTADAQERSNEATLYRIAAFKAGASGNSGAAAMYNAAADQKSGEAGLLRIAAVNTANRARFLLAASLPGLASASDQAADAAAAGDGADYNAGDPGQAEAARAKKYCKNAANATWGGGGLRLIARPGTWCHQGNVVTRVDLPKGAYDNDAVGFSALTTDADGCNTPERTPYNWQHRGPKSGLKINVNCTWHSRPGIVRLQCTAISMPDSVLGTAKGRPRPPLRA
jgi:hypothetical protein